jgi:hypothetical protein
MIEEYKKNLKKYIEQDKMYQKWKNNDLIYTETSDFDYFCIKHCEDIDNLLKENEKLMKLCDKYEKEHRTVFQLWLKEIDKYSK